MRDTFFEWTMRELYLETRKQWRDWLAANHDKSAGVWEIMGALCVLSILTLTYVGCHARESTQERSPVETDRDPIEPPGQVLPEQIDPVPPAL